MFFQHLHHKTEVVPETVEAPVEEVKVEEKVEDKKEEVKAEEVKEEAKTELLHMSQSYNCKHRYFYIPLYPLIHLSHPQYCHYTVR